MANSSDSLSTKLLTNYVHQVVTNTITSAFTYTTSSTSYESVTNLSISITPISTSSIIRLSCGINFCGVGSQATKLFRWANGSTGLNIANFGTSAGTAHGVNGNNDMGTYVFLLDFDTPGSTSTQTYNIQILDGSGVTTTFNKTTTDTNSTSFYRAAMQLIAMEYVG